MKRLLASLLIWLAPAGAAAPEMAPVHGYRVVRVYPHDPGAFTQGLVFVDGFLYEGTGLNGQSAVRKVKLETGQVLQKAALSEQYFGEGITHWGPTLVQLTWTSGVGFVYDRASFRPQRTFSFRGEGWGLTQDGRHLIMSDGTAALRYLDPASFREVAQVRVTDAGRPVANLNELEFVKGEILANVWQTERVVQIQPMTGRVTGWIDFGGLLSARERVGTDVMNGIAWDAKGDRLFVTGKFWPKLFEVKIVPRRPGGATR